MLCVFTSKMVFIKTFIAHKNLNSQKLVNSIVCKIMPICNILFHIKIKHMF